MSDKQRADVALVERGMSESRVKSVLHRMRKRLRSYLEKEGYL